MAADFRQYYNLSVYDAGKTYSIREAADLAASLPRTSRTFTSLNPASAWGDEEYLLTYIANQIADLVWLNTENGRKGINRPKPIQPPGEKKASKGYTTKDIDEIFARAAKKKEVENVNGTSVGVCDADPLT